MAVREASCARRRPPLTWRHEHRRRLTAEAEEDDIAECFWARLSSSSQFIAGDASRGRLYATVRPDDAYFLTSGCTPWVPA